MSNHDTSHVCNALSAFGVGLLVGAGLALLYAPHSGQETRDLLHRRKEELKGRAQDALHDAKDRIDEKKAEIVAAVEAGRDAMREKRAKFEEQSAGDA